tara:strand:- start:724 stop:1113 length:390 start_codon:yes stop_codon:yes gene_type:complete
MYIIQLFFNNHVIRTICICIVLVVPQRGIFMVDAVDLVCGTVAVHVGDAPVGDTRDVISAPNDDSSRPRASRGPLGYRGVVFGSYLSEYHFFGGYVGMGRYFSDHDTREYSVDGCDNDCGHLCLLCVYA